jgi:hypothetical protein
MEIALELSTQKQDRELSDCSRARMHVHASLLFFECSVASSHVKSEAHLKQNSKTKLNRRMPRNTHAVKTLLLGFDLRRQSLRAFVA